MALAGSQLVNILTSPYKGNLSGEGPFPPVSADSPSPQYMLVSQFVEGAFTVNDAGKLYPQYPNEPTANCAVTVEYRVGNQLQSAQILVTQALSAIQSGL